MAACHPAPEAQHDHLDKVKYCIYTYAIGNGKATIPVCSQYPLSGREVEHLNQQYSYTMFLYREFLEPKGLTLPAKTDRNLDIYFTTFEHINDVDYFPRKDPKIKIVGRYVNRVANIFLTRQALEDPLCTDAPHELAHWLNDVLGLKDKVKNEAWAQEFEAYYDRRVNG